MRLEKWLQQFKKVWKTEKLRKFVDKRKQKQ